HPVGEVIFHILPSRLREPNSLIHKNLLLWQPTEKGQLIEPGQLGAARAQIKALSLLQEHPKGLHQATCLHLGLSQPALKTLEKKQLIEPVLQTREEAPATNIPLLRSSPLTLNSEQKTALQHIQQG